jgi:hypothetical protein
MDIEKTMEFILESQARAEARADRADQRMDRAEKRADTAEKRADTAEKRMDRFDKQLQATEKLVRAGMKMLADQNRRINALIAAQARTDKKFERLMDTLRGSNGNGHR